MLRSLAIDAAVLGLCDPESGQFGSKAIRTLALGLLSLGPMILSNSRQGHKEMMPDQQVPDQH